MKENPRIPPASAAGQRIPAPDPGLSSRGIH
jgi:hypothetical protein